MRRRPNWFDRHDLLIALLLLIGFGVYGALGGFR